MPLALPSSTCRWPGRPYVARRERPAAGGVEIVDAKSEGEIASNRSVLDVNVVAGVVRFASLTARELDWIGIQAELAHFCLGLEDPDGLMADAGQTLDSLCGSSEPNAT